MSYMVRNSVFLSKHTKQILKQTLVGTIGKYFFQQLSCLLPLVAMIFGHLDFNLLWEAAWARFWASASWSAPIWSSGFSFVSYLVIGHCGLLSGYCSVWASVLTTVPHISPLVYRKLLELRGYFLLLIAWPSRIRDDFVRDKVKIIAVTERDKNKSLYKICGKMLPLLWLPVFLHGPTWYAYLWLTWAQCLDICLLSFVYTLIFISLISYLYELKVIYCKNKY